ncbi:Diacylglycerol kinase epsilon [Dirofilaria immitis]
MKRAASRTRCDTVVSDDSSARVQGWKNLVKVGSKAGRTKKKCGTVGVRICITTMIWPLLVISAFLLTIVQILKKVLRPKIVEYYSQDFDISSSGHHFVSLFHDDTRHYCNVCENGMRRGMQCDYCGVMVDCTSCLHSISSTFRCKITVTSTDGEIMHHWVRGNLPSCSICGVCNEECGDGVGLIDSRCSFCQFTVHTRCKHQVNRCCTMGVNRDFIVPPTCVTVRRVGNRRNKQLIVDTICRPSNVDYLSWKPLFVIVNPKSGGAEGFAVLRIFRKLLHPVQVINVQEIGIGTALRWIKMYPEIDCRIIIAGGDGTVSLALDAINELQRKIPVAVLPLGTGNDLSRTLGWGSGREGLVDFFEICRNMRNAKTIKLDRWMVDIIHKRQLGIRAKNKRFSMVNYVSVGVDACVTYGMQSTRDSIRKIVSSRFLNKFLFFTFGTKDVLEHACANLDRKIELTVDGIVIPLPPIEGLIVLNIPFWGAGVRPWVDLFSPQAINDRKFEVFAVRSSFHIAQMQIGISQGISLAQGSTLKLRIFDTTLPVQCDGEAWLQSPGIMHISHKDQAFMLIHGNLHVG